MEIEQWIYGRKTERRVDIMMKLSERIMGLLEEYDFSVCGEITERYGEKGQYDIELETYSPEGENVLVPLTYDGTEESFINEFADYAEGFDVEDHAEMWIGSRGKNGVPDSIKDLLEDAEWIKDTLMEIADELNNFDEESDGKEYTVSIIAYVDVTFKAKSPEEARRKAEKMYGEHYNKAFDYVYLSEINNVVDGDGNEV